MTNTTTKTPAEAAREADFGRPSARKSGRRSEWPYVPVLIVQTDVPGRTQEQQIVGLAFATREEAIAAAEGHILRLRHVLQAKLEQPRFRALRAQYGVE